MANVRSITTVLGILIMIGLITAIFYLHLSFLSVQYDKEKYLLTIGNLVYDLENPAEKHVLPSELIEISGLAFYQTNQLACIQDEAGLLFIYDVKKKKIVMIEAFGDKGDYEGIEIVNDTAYALRSDGRIYSFQIGKNGIGETELIKTDLSSKNNTEGLAYFPSEGKLLIACKEKSSIKNKKIEGHGLFQVDLPAKNFNSTPFLEFTNDQVKDAIDDSKLDRRNHLPFKPSAITVFQETNDLLIVSSVGKLILKMNSSGAITAAIPLKRKLLFQPEGICFDNQGTLYISSEGKNENGYILEFRPIRANR